MGVLWNQSGLIARDNNDVRALGALAYFYDAGTSTPKVVYQDSAETTPHANPVEADGNGRWPAIYVPFGSHKEQLTTDVGSAIGAVIDNIPNPAPFNDSFTLDTTTILNTGDVFFSLKNGTRSGAVRLNGRSIGNAASSATERANADTDDLFAFLWDNVADGQAAVSGGRGATAAADFAANKRLTLPDWRGASIVGLDDMGNTAASLLASAPVVTGAPTTAGSVLGGNTQTLATGNLPSHTHTGTTGAGSAHTHGFSATTGTESVGHTHAGLTDSGGDHTHTVNDATTKVGTFTGGGSNGWGGNSSVSTGSGGAHQHTFTTAGVSASHTHTVSGTSASESLHTHTFTSDATGSGTAHNIVQRSGLVTYFIKL